MSETFDFAGVFDEDYLYFYESMLDGERNERETTAIIELLGLTPGDTVLDVPCGHGRISNRLAQRGFSVTGVDVTPLFLERARTDAAARGVDVTYIQGDMRSLTFDSEFDALANWFTSFGYFDDETNRSVLAGFRRALKPGGKLIMEHLNRDRVIRNLPEQGLPPRVILFEHGKDFMTDRIELDALTGRTHTERTIVRDGSVRRTTFTVRTFTFPEIRDWLLGAGFSRVEGFGAQGEPFSLYSQRTIVIATA
ncbi:MAG: class I SAM-dependent methyltransferase [Actinomycetota bacterium]|nr:methyltransferase domain-containing protein [Actinomycetota bacterium]